MLSILTTLALTFAPSFASLYHDRAAEASRRSYDRDQADAENVLMRGNRAQLAAIRTFIGRHGGATNDVTCGIFPMHCEGEGNGYGVCRGFGDQQQVRLSEINPDQIIAIGSCDVTTRDGLACQIDKKIRTTRAECYDAQLRHRSYKLHMENPGLPE